MSTPFKTTEWAHRAERGLPDSIAALSPEKRAALRWRLADWLRELADWLREVEGFATPLELVDDFAADADAAEALEYYASLAHDLRLVLTLIDTRDAA